MIKKGFDYLLIEQDEAINNKAIANFLNQFNALHFLPFTQRTFYYIFVSLFVINAFFIRFESLC